MDNRTPAEAASDILWPGKPYPLGAAYDGAGTNFALFSSAAERVYLCLFDESGVERRVELTGQGVGPDVPADDDGQEIGPGRTAVPGTDHGVLLRGGSDSLAAGRRDDEGPGRASEA